jgi:hypothetical protein
MAYNDLADWFLKTDVQANTLDRIITTIESMEAGTGPAEETITGNIFEVKLDGVSGVVRVAVDFDTTPEGVQTLSLEAFRERCGQRLKER